MRTGRVTSLASLLIALSAAGEVEARDGRGKIEDVGSVDRLSRRVEDVVRRVRPATVRIRIADYMPSNGIVVTPDGHILTSARVARSNRDRQVNIHFDDGRRLVARQLGWSTVWNVGLLKVSSDQPFRYVRLLDQAIGLEPGDGCVTLGFPHREGATSSEPEFRFGRVSQVFDPTWCSTTCNLHGGYGLGLYDLEGRLLGVYTRSFFRGPIFTMTAPIREMWRELTSGNISVDEIRFSNVARASSNKAGVHDNILQKHLDRASAATVRLVTNGRHMWSGVIVSAEGLIATCAHHYEPPGTRIDVLLADGRTVAGRILGVNPVTDIGLVKIVDEGEWPYVDLGSSTAMQPGMPATVMGFPKDYSDRKPLIRHTKIVNERRPGLQPGVSRLIYTDAKLSRFRGGDSGGGLFDSRGRLLGIISGVRVEALQQQWETLSAAEPYREIPSPDRISAEAAFVRPAEEVNQSVVEVLSDGKRACIGVVVHRDGKIVTKRSELRAKLTCRLADGAEYEAELVHSSRLNDLALLAIKTNVELPTPKWSERLPGRFAFTAAVLPDKPRPRVNTFPLRDSPLVGIVTERGHSVPGVSGWIGSLADREEGVMVRSSRLNADGVEQNDFILAVNGQPTPNLESLYRVLNPDDSAPIAYAGEFVRLKIRRRDQVQELRVKLSRTPAFYAKYTSDRRTGFTRALDVDISISPQECGAPIIDSNGKICGITIATRGIGRTYVLTADVVRAFLAQPRDTSTTTDLPVIGDALAEAIDRWILSDDFLKGLGEAIGDAIEKELREKLQLQSEMEWSLIEAVFNAADQHFEGIDVDPESGVIVIHFMLPALKPIRSKTIALSSKDGHPVLRLTRSYGLVSQPAASAVVTGQAGTDRVVSGEVMLIWTQRRWVEVECDVVNETIE